MAVVDHAFREWFGSVKDANPHYFDGHADDSRAAAIIKSVAQKAFSAGRSAERAQQPAAVDEAMVDVLRIPEQHGLDPIVVYFEDYAPGRGRATVACYGDAWTAAWGAMGDRTVREFVASVDPDYLADSLQELTGTTKARQKYADRIAKAVSAALAGRQQGGAA